MPWVWLNEKLYIISVQLYTVDSLEAFKPSKFPFRLGLEHI